MAVHVGWHYAEDTSWVCKKDEIWRKLITRKYKQMTVSSHNESEAVEFLLYLVSCTLTRLYFVIWYAGSKIEYKEFMRELETVGRLTFSNKQNK